MNSVFMSRLFETQTRFVLTITALRFACMLFLRDVAESRQSKLACFAEIQQHYYNSAPSRLLKTQSYIAKEPN